MIESIVTSPANLNPLLLFSAQIFPFLFFMVTVWEICIPILLCITYYLFSHSLQDNNHETLDNRKDDTNETIEVEDEDDEYSDEEQDDEEEEEHEEDPEPEEVENWEEKEKKEHISDEKRTEMGKQEQTITETDLQVSYSTIY